MPNLCPPRSRLDPGRRGFPLTDVKQAAVSVPKENQYECGQEIFLMLSLFYGEEWGRTLTNIQNFDVQLLRTEMTIFAFEDFFQLDQHLAVIRSTSLHITYT